MTDHAPTETGPLIDRIIWRSHDTHRRQLGEPEVFRPKQLLYASAPARPVAEG